MERRCDRRTSAPLGPGGALDVGLKLAPGWPGAVSWAVPVLSMEEEAELEATMG